MTVSPQEEIPSTKLFEPVLPYQASVYVTVLNIIQCIALGFLILEAREVVIEEKMSFSWVLRSSVALGSILLIWHSYVSELQYLWPMTLLDTIMPFSIGITEVAIVFSTNPETASLDLFVGCIAVLQFTSSFAFGSAYLARTKEATKSLYRYFYLGYPQFAFHLTSFLKKKDRLGFLWFLISFGISLFFLFLTILLPFGWYEIAIPLFYLAALIQGEYFGNFQKNLRDDITIGHYFK